MCTKVANHHSENPAFSVVHFGCECWAFRWYRNGIYKQRLTCCRYFFIVNENREIFFTICNNILFVFVLSLSLYLFHCCIIPGCIGFLRNPFHFLPKWNIPMILMKIYILIATFWVDRYETQQKTKHCTALVSSLRFRMQFVSFDKTFPTKNQLLFDFIAHFFTFFRCCVFLACVPYYFVPVIRLSGSISGLIRKNKGKSVFFNEQNRNNGTFPPPSLLMLYLFKYKTLIRNNDAFYNNNEKTQLCAMESIRFFSCITMPYRYVPTQP